MSSGIERVQRASEMKRRTEDEWRAAIRDAHAAGHSLRAIGADAGISHVRVMQIVRPVDKRPSGPRVWTLYRLFDAADVLLYIGISKHPPTRYKQHEKGRQPKPWWGRVFRKTEEFYATKSDAAAAEILAIRAETPLFNVRGA